MLFSCVVLVGYIIIIKIVFVNYHGFSSVISCVFFQLEPVINSLFTQMLVIPITVFTYTFYLLYYKYVQYYIVLPL